MTRLAYRTWGPYWVTSSVWGLSVGWAYGSDHRAIAAAVSTLGAVGLPVWLAHRLERRFRPKGTEQTP